MLIHYRCSVTQEFIGLFYGVDRRVICRAIKRVEGHAKSLFAVRRNPRISKREAQALIIDCTKQPIEPPEDNATQEAHSSGKTKRHTLKTEYIASAEGRIAGAEGRVASVSASYPGSRHDLTIRRAGPPLSRRA